MRSAICKYSLPKERERKDDERNLLRRQRNRSAHRRKWPGPSVPCVCVRTNGIIKCVCMSMRACRLLLPRWKRRGRERRTAAMAHKSSSILLFIFVCVRVFSCQNIKVCAADVNTHIRKCMHGSIDRSINVRVAFLFTQYHNKGWSQKGKAILLWPENNRDKCLLLCVSHGPNTHIDDLWQILSMFTSLSSSFV